MMEAFGHELNQNKDISGFYMVSLKHVRYRASWIKSIDCMYRHIDAFIFFILSARYK